MGVGHYAMFPIVDRSMPALESTCPLLQPFSTGMIIVHGQMGPKELGRLPDPLHRLIFE